MPKGTLYTAGHSTRSAEELLALLGEARIGLLVDVRRYPGSRRHPEFAQDVRAASLAACAFEYRHEIDLGGRRGPRMDSPNQAWRAPGFRGYADHMRSAEFQAALARIETLAAGRRTAILCAEAHPSRCHRRLISDALVARGWSVIHLVASGRVEAHKLHPQARPGPDGTLVYPALRQDELGFD